MPLEIQVVAESPLTLSADVLVLPVLAGANLKQEPLSYLNEALSGAVAKIVAREEWKAQKEQILEVNVGGVLPFFKVVLYGIGQRGQMTNADWRTYAAKAAQVANAAKATSLVARRARWLPARTATIFERRSGPWRVSVQQIHDR